MDKGEILRIEGNLRSNYHQVPKEVYEAKGIVVMGRRIKSVVFSTDVALIRNCNADGVLAVYPFTPQQIISQAIINVSPMPVFVGVGGGLTNGFRSALIAKDAEAQGAWGVVVNAPVSSDCISLIRKAVDIPVIATIVNRESDLSGKIRAGASIFNVSAAEETPKLVSYLKSVYPAIPIIATGGPTAETIEDTIRAGADCISYTPPSTGEMFAAIMQEYRRMDNSNDDNEIAFDRILEGLNKEIEK